MDEGEDKNNDNNMQQQQAALMEQLRQRYLQQVSMQELIAQQQQAAQYQQFMRMQHYLWALQQQRQYDNYRYSRFTSFLESDDSFFSPWSRNPNNRNQEETSVNSSDQPRQQRMVFQIGSFFSYNLFSPTSEAPDQSEGSEKANSDIATKHTHNMERLLH